MTLEHNTESTGRTVTRDKIARFYPQVYVERLTAAAAVGHLGWIDQITTELAAAGYARMPSDASMFAPEVTT
jgi:hypothetical protein